MGKVRRVALVVCFFLSLTVLQARGADVPTVGIAMPNTTELRWLRDGSELVSDLSQLGFRTDAHNAGNDVALQISQVRGMIAAGDRALIIAPVVDRILADVLIEAGARHIPVISYDRLIRGTPNIDFYVSFDNRQVGVEQAQSLLQGLGFPATRGPFTIELFAGSPDDSNTYEYFEGAMSVLRPLIEQGVVVVGSGQTAITDVTTLRWSADAAHARLDNLLVAFYVGRRLNAVLSPNDEISSGIIASLRDAGYGSGNVKMAVVTGQDCEPDAVRAILAGRQYSSVFKDTRDLAKGAADMVGAVLDGRTPRLNTLPGPDNGGRHVPAQLLPPVIVDRANIDEVLLRSGYYTRADID